MYNNILETRTVVQLGIIVRDVNITSKKYAQFFGIEIPQVIISMASLFFDYV
mgnify:CR=1 FL=1